MKEDQDFEILATAEAQKRRLAFFGRPAQKCSLKKRQHQVLRPAPHRVHSITSPTTGADGAGVQMERNEWEHQAAMFNHLWSDAKQEHDENEKRAKKAKREKEKVRSRGFMQVSLVMI
jgi:hypothetical protein